MKTVIGHFRRFIDPVQTGGAPVFVVIFSVALSIYAVTVCAPPAFDTRWSLYLDSSSLYWVQSLWDNSLFPGDRQTAYFQSMIKGLHPISLWVWVTAIFMRTFPYAIGLKFLSVLACAGSGLLVRQLALSSISGRAASAAAFLFTVLFLSMDTFFGSPRVFGVLVFLGFAVSMEQRRFLILPLIVILCSIVYPVISVGLGISAALTPACFRSEFAGQKLLVRYLALLAAAATFCILLATYSAMLLPTSPNAAKVAAFQSYKYHQIPGSPQLSPEVAMDFLANFVLNFNEHGRLYIVLLSLFLLIYCLGILVIPRRPAFLPRSIPVLLAGCGIAFLLLYAVHPVSASRQLIFIVPLAAVFLSMEGLLAVFGENLRDRGVAIVCALGFVCMHPWLGETVSMRAYSRIYDFLSTQPPDTLVAGYPDSALTNTVPVFARRGVMLSAETEDPELLFLGGPAEYDAKRRDLLKALYCVAGARQHLAREYGVDWLLIERKFYSPDFFTSAESSRLADAEATAIFGSGAEACYLGFSKEAEFSWKNGNTEGLAVRLVPQWRN